MIKYGLFDCDGLMFNTEQISQGLWRQEAKKYGIVIPDLFFKKITGAGKDVDLSEFYRNQPQLETLREEMRVKRFDLSFWSSFEKDGLNKKGLKDLCAYLDEHDIPWAICSSSNAEYVETLVHTVDQQLHYRCIVGGNHVKKGKPDPEIFLLGAKMLGADPAECLVLEDSKQGLTAGKRAGMYTCFIQDTIIKDAEMQKNIDEECNDLSGVIRLLEGSL